MTRLRRWIPDTPIGKARLSGVSIGIAMLLAQSGGMGNPAHSATWTAVSLIALFLMVGALAATYAFRRTPPLEALWVPVLVAVAGSGLTDTIATMGLCLAVAVAQSMYGSTAVWALRSLLLIAAFPAAVAMSPYSFGQSISWHGPSVMSPIPALLLISLLMRAYHRSLLGQQRAGERDAVLASSGSRLIGVTDPQQVRLLGATVAERLSDLSSGAVCLVVEQRLGGITILYGADPVIGMVGMGLPDAVVAELATADVGEVRTLTAFTPAFGSQAPTLRHWRGSVLPAAGSARYLLVGSTRPVSDDVVNAYRNFAYQLAFAEENCRAHGSLNYQANHDHLTTLANRGQLLRLLTAAMDDEAAVTLLAIDLDDFKQVNDIHGHGAGDELLIEVAKRLDEVGRPHGLAARFGGDEFALLLLDGSDDVEAVAQRLCRRLMEPMQLSAGTVTVGASIGLATATADLTAGDLLRCADIAMYSAKAAGKNRVERFTTTQHGDIAHHRLLEEHLAHAVERDEIVLQYQPYLNLDTGECVGVEAFPSWRHPSLGLLRPEEFVPIAERIGQLAPLSAQTLRVACAELASQETPPAGTGLRLSLDVASVQLQDVDFPATVRQILAETSFPASRLVLQIVDSEQLHEDAVRQRLHELANTGVRVALCDFGTADASLAPLQTLPIHQLKTGCGVLNQYADRFDADDMVRLVVSAGDILGLEVVVEGVDTTEQADRLRAVGISLAQGAAFAGPMSIADLREWLSRSAMVSAAHRAAS